MLAEAYRRMPAERKWQIVQEELRRIRLLHDLGYRRRHPEATAEQARHAWVAAVLGPVSFPDAPEGQAVNAPIEQLETLRDVILAFDRLRIAYALGGSLASSLHGAVRATRDADLAAEPFPGREADFVSCFSDPYYISEEAVREAIRNRSCFNVINTMTAFKVDVFIQRGRAFDLSLMARREASPFPGLDGQEIQVVTAEDVVLLKLEWFRLGGEVTVQQWDDILSVLRAKSGRLDASYLDRWAAELGVLDLLGKARDEATL
ncbi:hypothetical protein AB1L88_23760 [Tautonia sp. JC769]|uniref:hypothetical protein n=1 Tax=Tautonia sp. JC769 TaxID=3232135 RepID=UPI003458D944